MSFYHKPANGTIIIIDCFLLSLLRPKDAFIHKNSTFRCCFLHNCSLFIIINCSFSAKSEKSLRFFGFGATISGVCNKHTKDF